jgi:hypothetical protein
VQLAHLGGVVGTLCPEFALSSATRRRANRIGTTNELRRYAGMGARPSSRGTHSMSKRHDYLDNAAQTLELANRAAALGDKSHLADLAERWIDLADRTQRRPTHSAHRIEEHPLVKRAFRYFRA